MDQIEICSHPLKAPVPGEGFIFLESCPGAHLLYPTLGGPVGADTPPLTGHL